MAIRFGTDGWRGVIAEDFTFDNVRLCTQGVVRYLQQRGLAERGLVVGYDTRFASEDFALAVAETAAGAGVKTYLSDRAAPTPVVTYNVIDRNAGGAVIITASHNPPQWNGFKFKPEYAGSASPDVTDEIERLIEDAAREGIENAAPWERARSDGTGVDVNPAPAYVQHVGRLVDLERLRASGLKLAVDPMFGAGAGYLPYILGGGATTLDEIHAERNPLFPGLRQPEPVADNLSALCAQVAETGADAGLALDGDADRFGLVDERGIVINPLQVFALLALYMLETRGDRGPLVKSTTTSRMLYRLGEIFDVPVHETPVGFKYVGPLMERERALIGGEESGGYGFRGHIPERDGILSALFILDMMVDTGKRPSELLAHLYDLVGPHHYDRSDIPLSPGQRETIAGVIGAASPDTVAGVRVASSDATDGRRFVLEDGSWVTVRLSGTEPLVRIYAEGPSPERVEALLAEARGLVGL